MAIGNLNVGVPKQIVASQNIKSSNGALVGIYVSAASATPTITIYDDAATGTTNKIVDSFTPVSSQWYPIPLTYAAGLNVVLGGTVSCTVVYL